MGLCNNYGMNTKPDFKLTITDTNDGTLRILDLAIVSADDVAASLTQAGYEQRPYADAGIFITGDFGVVWAVNPITGTGHPPEDTTPKTPFEVYVAAKLLASGNFSPVEAYVAWDRMPILNALGAEKRVKGIMSTGAVDGVSYNEYDGDIKHFHEYLASDYSDLLVEMGISNEDEISDMEDADVGILVVNNVFPSASWYTDGGGLYSVEDV